MLATILCSRTNAPNSKDSSERTMLHKQILFRFETRNDRFCSEVERAGFFRALTEPKLKESEPNPSPSIAKHRAKSRAYRSRRLGVHSRSGPWSPSLG